MGQNSPHLRHADRTDPGNEKGANMAIIVSTARDANTLRPSWHSSNGHSPRSEHGDSGPRDVGSLLRESRRFNSLDNS
jgi:hypothetical protein